MDREELRRAYLACITELGVCPGCEVYGSNGQLLEPSFCLDPRALSSTRPALKISTPIPVGHLRLLSFSLSRQSSIVAWIFLASNIMPSTTTTFRTQQGAVGYREVRRVYEGAHEANQRLYQRPLSRCLPRVQRGLERYNASAHSLMLYGFALHRPSFPPLLQ